MAEVKFYHIFLLQMILTLKYVPMTIYMYSFLNSLYTSIKERTKQKQVELDDIQLQVTFLHV